jgi:hypothetical protein
MEKIMNILNKFRSLLHDRKGDEFAQKAVILILIGIAGVGAIGVLGSRIVALLNQAASGI